MNRLTLKRAYTTEYLSMLCNLGKERRKVDLPPVSESGMSTFLRQSDCS